MQKPAKFYQASSSEMYGKVVEIPQTEKTPFYPAALMAVQNCTVSGKPSIIANPMPFLPVMAFYSTTNPLAAAKPL